MFLGVDIGNTHIVAGIYQGEKLLDHWRFSTDKQKTEDEYLVLISQLMEFKRLSIDGIEEMAISSVVPSLTDTWQSLARKHFRLEPLVVDSNTDTGMPILLDYPEEAGADRIINAMAAYAQHKTALIIVDFGTATTFDCISDYGEYLGGAIAPGIEISREALFSHAARLSSVPLEQPKAAIGRNTAESLQAGMYWGFAGQVDAIVRKQKEELGEDVKVIATGGLAQFITEYSETIEEVDLLLTLKGLRILNLRLAAKKGETEPS